MDIRTRKDIPARYRWDLSNQFKDKQALKACERQILDLIQSLSALRGKAAEDPAKAVTTYFSLSRLTGNYITFSRMQQDLDGTNNTYKEQMAKAEDLAVRARAAGAFLSPELLSLTQDHLISLRDSPAHPQYSVFFHNLIRQRQHILPPEQEELLAQAGEVFATAARTFNMFNNVDLPLPDTLNEDGTQSRLTHAGFNLKMRSRNRAVRKAAFEGMHQTFGKFSATLSTLYISSIKKDILQSRLRRYDSARAASLYAHEIPLSVYDGLLREAHKAFPVLDRYLRLRKKALGLEELHLYDLYVPIAEGFSMDLPYPEAAKLVKRGLKPLGAEYAKLLDHAYTQRWIDVYETRGKRSGAYSWGTYDSHPYVLLNHTDTIDGAMTLAHELGHAMHSFHSNQTQPYEKAGYSLFAAEVASTCNEVLVSRALQEEHRDNPQALVFFLTDLAEGFRTTFFRQTMFAEFEHEAYKLAEAGAALTDKALDELYLKLNTLYYGRECVIDPDIRHEWLRIPHFYRAFYVYQYATGFSAAVYLADRILREGDEAREKYFSFLKSGGSIPPIEALKNAGADMTRPGVIRGAMKVFEDTVAQLEKLIG
ncbi:MAG TPA: oligoendopeptidase F [Clostridia bacterium]|jgi:oligoendopeptidase F|nr:oligoendopeptidase F [Clostridia bacterium]HPY43154.1 oligoendopeptidase F [Clostridia bacterium]HQA96391.1 oligoendopeptidase F [Clostridia bacterium]HQO55956.1 oligoendopeptidase F [Clostridia bacterium]